MAFRDQLWDHGFAIAEAMDTAQRGMGLSWPQAKELIVRTAERATAARRGGGGRRRHRPARRRSASRVAGDRAGVRGAARLRAGDRRPGRAHGEPRAGRHRHLGPGLPRRLRVPAEAGRSAGDPALARRRIRSAACAATGAACSSSAAADLVVELIERAEGRVDGVKLSVLDADREVALRRRFPPGVRMYTGDDFNYAELIRGGPSGHSDALLGAFAAITAPAAEALQALDAGDLARLRRGDESDRAVSPEAVRGADVVLQGRRRFPGLVERIPAAFPDARTLREPPVGRTISSRCSNSLLAAGALRDPDLAVERMSRFLSGRQRSVIGLDRLSLNQATVKRLDAARSRRRSACGIDIGGIGLWRDRVAEIGVSEAAVAAREASRACTSPACAVGGSSPIRRVASDEAAIADNRAAIEEAAALEADVLVLVSGGLPPGSRDLPAARRAIADAIAELVPRAEELGVRLGIEALHPMFCADRCAISTLGQALDLALHFPSSAVGVVVDSYHVWWDPNLVTEIARAGDRIASYQLCDWTVPLPADMLLGRGHLGDGFIDFGSMTDAVETAGYEGFVEVEIFNQQIWDAPADETVGIVKRRFADLLA